MVVGEEYTKLEYFPSIELFDVQRLSDELKREIGLS